MAIQKKFKKFNIISYMFLGIIGGIISYILSLIFRYIDIPIFYSNNQFISVTASIVDIDLRNQIVRAGYFPEVGQIVLDFLQGKLGINYQYIFSLLFMSVIVLIAGRILYGYMVTKESDFLQSTRIFWSYIIGGALFTILLVFVLGLPFGILSSVLAYTFVVGAIVQLMSNTKKLPIIHE